MLNNHVSILDIVSSTNTVSNQVETVQNQISDVYTFKTSNVIKVGNLNDIDSVLSNFTVDNYATLPINFNPGNLPWECVFEFTTPDDISTIGDQSTVELGLRGVSCCYLNAGSLTGRLYLSSNGTDWDIVSSQMIVQLTSSTTYKLKTEFTGTQYKVSRYLNNSWNELTTVNSSTPICGGICYLGVNPRHGQSMVCPTDCNINLNECYININGTRIWSGTSISKSTILDILYPVGSIYIGTMSVCPLQVLGVGTWRLIAGDKVIQSAGTRGNAGQTLNESLPNITGSIGLSAAYKKGTAGAFYVDSVGTGNGVGFTTSDQWGTYFNASFSSSTYQDNAPVQPDAYLVNIWERIS